MTTKELKEQIEVNLRFYMNSIWKYNRNGDFVDKDRHAERLYDTLNGLYCLILEIEKNQARSKEVKNDD